MEHISPLEYSARVIVELLPLTKKLSSDEDAKDFPSLRELLARLQQRVRRHNYSKEALLSLIQEEFLDGKSVFDLAELIGSTAFCQFPIREGDFMLFGSVSQNPPKLREDFGDELYVKDDTPDKPSATSRPPRIAPSPATPINPREDLSTLPAIIALKRKYTEISRPNEKYYWQWRVSTEDYVEFRRLLDAVDFTSRPTEKVRLCAKELAFYVAEWYKREYDGNESDNCLGSIGLNSGYSKQIWEGAHPDDGDLPYRTEGTDRHEWLYSMYVLGGFPIRYTQRAARFSPLFDEMWGEDRSQDTISEDQLDELTLGFDGNQVVKNSLISGSLHEYYRFLLIQESMPIAESDNDKEPFAAFIKNLQEGKQHYYEHFLKPVWYLYVDPHDNLVEGELRVTFGRKGDRCYIPVECLRYWSIPAADSLQEFDIDVLDTKTGAKKSLRFSKSGPGDFPYVGWSRENRITFPLAYDKIGAIEVRLSTESGQYKIGSPLSFGGCRQFYKTALPYEWSTKVDNGSHTAVLFNPVSFSIDDSLNVEDKCFEEGGQVWKWVPLTEEIVLVSPNGDGVSFSPRNNALSLSFKPLRDTIRYINFRDVVHYRLVDDELIQTAVPLLQETGVIVKYTPFGSSTSEIVTTACKLFFKKPEEFRYSEWGPDNKPGQGLLQIRVLYTEKGVSASRLVYYLPQANPIRRVVRENKIIFGKNLSDVFAPEGDGFRALEKDSDGTYVYQDDLVSGYDVQSDTIPFILGKPNEDYVEIDVFRSAVCKELYLKNMDTPLKRYDGTRGVVEIPAILRDNFEVRAIDEKGVSRTKCGKDVFMRFDFNVRQPQRNSCNYLDDEENGIRYYVVKGHGVPNGRLGQIQLETGPGQYRFYYWSMNAGESPYLLEQSFDSETKILTVDTSPLEKNRSGIIFQSLKGLSPRHYFRPFYGDNSPARFNSALRVWCFDVASEHGIPFQLFQNLKDMVMSNDPVFRILWFLVDLMELRHWKPSLHDFRNLHRFANEFLFDWMLIPRWKWRTLRNEDSRTPIFKDPARREVVNRLFRTAQLSQRDDKEYLERIIDMYWDLPASDTWNFRRSSRPENLLVQCIRRNGNDYSCLDDKDFENRMTVFRSIHGCRDIYEGAFRLLKQATNR